MSIRSQLAIRSTTIMVYVVRDKIYPKMSESKAQADIGSAMFVLI
jgi:hypothetical protein